MSISEQMKPDHLKTARAVGHVLMIGDYEAWSGLVHVLRGRLTPQERAALAFAALKAIGCADAVKAVEDILFASEKEEGAA